MVSLSDSPFLTLEEAASVNPIIFAPSLEAALSKLNLVLVLGFAAGMIWLIIAEGRKQKASSRRIADLGYTPIKSPSAALLERVQRIYQRGSGQKLELQNAFQRPIADGRVVLFDLVDTSGNESSWLGTRIMGVLSPSLHLPHFMLEPKLQLKPEGQVAAFMLHTAEKVIDWAASKGGYERVSFSAHPDFEQRFIVFGRAETELRLFLTGDRLDRLAGLERAYKIAGAGDMFTLVRAEASDGRGARKKVALEEEIDLLFADAQQVLAWLQ